MEKPLNLSVQMAAKAVLQHLVEHITPRSTEASIARFCAHALAKSGFPETWYYNCPAFVLLGSRSVLSVSGRDYKPSDEAVGTHNLITVDLSPKLENVWGDCARSFYMEGGVCRAVPVGDEFIKGYELEHRLHELMCGFVRPETTFHELHAFANDLIVAAGFENLDFSGNVGHSICERQEDRLYVEAGNNRRLGEVSCFTFEPHLRQNAGVWGFKHENIYFFGEHGGVCEL
jgi:Xaa-Pro aminopeptidase